MCGGLTVDGATGDIVERQSYLNGTRYYLVEGESMLAGAAWTWTLSMTLPKEPSEPIAEGDLSLVSGERSWYADVAGGSFSETIDEALDEQRLEIDVLIVRRQDGDGTESWSGGSATVSLGVDTCDLTLTLEGEPQSGVGNGA